jgi:hypothetical protein
VQCVTGYRMTILHCRQESVIWTISQPTRVDVARSSTMITVCRMDLGDRFDCAW